METKELVGYKFIKPEYKEALLSILNTNSCEGWWEEDAERNLKEKGYHFGHSQVENSIAGILQKAAVLDLWCEPVYKEIEPQFKEGDWLFTRNYINRTLLRYNGVDKNDYLILKESYSISNIDDNIIYKVKKPDILFSRNLKVATYFEIENTLTIVAKDKGFVKGVLFEPPNLHFKTKSDGIYKYDDFSDCLCCNGVYVYIKGKWGEIVKKDLMENNNQSIILNKLFVNNQIYITALYKNVKDIPPNYTTLTGFVPYIIDIKNNVNLVFNDEKYDLKINGGIGKGSGIVFSTPQEAIEDGINFVLEKIKNEESSN